jgi:hypothetical protein
MGRAKVGDDANVDIHFGPPLAEKRARVMSALRGGVTVVLDCGGGSLKVGIAGEAEPRWYAPTPSRPLCL